MSHVTTIETEIKHIDCLERAAKAVGLEFKRGQTSYKWFGRSVGDYPLPEGMSEKDLGRCIHAIGVPNNSQAYEIGVVNINGKYKLIWDFWNGGYGIEEIAGRDCKKILKHYAAEVAMKQMRREGYRVRKVVNQDGTLRVRASR